MKALLTTILLFIFSHTFAQNFFKVKAGADISQVIQMKDSSYVCIGTYTIYGAQPFPYWVLLHISAHGNYISGLFLDDGFSHRDLGYSLVKTSDGGFAALGSIFNNIKLLKFDSTVTLQWQKTYAFSFISDLSGINLLQLKNKNFLIAGNITDKGYLLQTDSIGNIQWSKSYFDNPAHPYYSSIASAKFNDISEDKDGFICVGTTASETTDTTYLIKLNKTGDVIWSKYLNASFRNNNFSLPKSITVATDYSSYTIAGTTIKKFTVNQTDSAFARQLFVTNTDTAGNIIWSKTNAPDSSYQNFSLVRIKNDTDGGYICAGTLQELTPVDTAYHAAYLLKLNAQGALQWTKTIDEFITSYSTFHKSYAGIDVNDVIRTNDNGYCLTGNYNNGGLHISANYTYLMYKLDALLNICSGTRSYGTLVDLPGNTVSAPVPVTPYNIDTINSTVTLSAGSYATILCDNNIIVPLHLLSFTANLQNNNKVVVEWKTTNEVNTDYFIVQRSYTPTSFTDLQQVKAASSGSNVNTYDITDNFPLSGTSYYRLKQVDKDGKTTYSSVVSVMVSSKGTIVIAPNPVQSVVNVRIQSSITDKVILRITDITGKTLALKQIIVVPGSNAIAIPAASLIQGIYILKVIANNGRIQTLKFIKE